MLFTDACVPAAARAAWAREARTVYAYRRRTSLFAAQLAKLSGRMITRDRLLEVFQELRVVHYQAGYHACERKWRKRVGLDVGERDGTG